LERFERWRFVAVDVGDFERALTRVSVNGFAAGALHEPQRRLLGKRDTIGQPFGWRVSAEPVCVKSPEGFDLFANVVGAGDFVGVGTIADGTTSELVCGRLHCFPKESRLCAVAWMIAICELDHRCPAAPRPRPRKQLQEKPMGGLRGLGG
jgi:hypothetical protein